MPKKTKSPPFLMVPRYLYRCKAWRSLDGNARSIFLELVDRFNGHNNGTIALGNRDAGALFGKEKDTGRRGLDMLVDRGFIVVTSDSTFHQKRLAREWRLTHLPDDRTGHKATKDFMIWAPEIQNIGAQVRSIGAQVRSEPIKTPKKEGHRRTGAPVMDKSGGSQARQCATSRSTIPPSAEVAQDAPEEAPPQQGARPPEERTSGGLNEERAAPVITAALMASLAKRGGLPPPKRASFVSGAVSSTLLATLAREKNP